ncbi:MAG: DUF1338 family protein [SAR324 cluster bacterium]|nr:DUF1338 family protein [SAR324 cluster bacterium]
MQTSFKKFVSSKWLLDQFVHRLIAVYEAKIPLFKKMGELVRAVNQQGLDDKIITQKQLDLLNQIMHGAIRVASVDELKMFRKIFAVMSLYPHGYYDLRNNILCHSTAFRDVRGLYFRMFNSVLDLERVDKKHKAFVKKIISARRPFSSALIDVVEKFDKQGALTHPQAEVFLSELVALLSRPKKSVLTKAEYSQLGNIHVVLTQILASGKPCGNHLTYNTWDMFVVQKMMRKWGIEDNMTVTGGAKDFRNLLHQHACLAPEIVMDFLTDDKKGYVSGKYAEEFIEIEARHTAVSRFGYATYTQCLINAKNKVSLLAKEDKDVYAKAYYAELAKSFEIFPRDVKLQILHGLGYYKFKPSKKGLMTDIGVRQKMNMRELVVNDFFDWEPIPYKDFIAVSATEIFNANIGLGLKFSGEQVDLNQFNYLLKEPKKMKLESLFEPAPAKSEGQLSLESAMECDIIDPFIEDRDEQWATIVNSCLEMGIDVRQATGLSA